MIIVYVVSAISLFLSFAVSRSDGSFNVGEMGKWFVLFEVGIFGSLYWLATLVKKQREQQDAIEEDGGNRPLRSRDNELGSGDLASDNAIRAWTKKVDQLGTALAVKDLRGASGIVLRSGDLIMPSQERNRHVLIVAKTGSGKTTKLILPVLYNDCLCPKRSTIVIDSKPEMWDKLAGLTKRYNPQKNILLFNPLDMVRSMSWNILSKIENDSDAKLIANTVIMATDNPNTKADSPFFRNNALQLLTSMMVGLLNDPNEKLSMPRIHRLAHSGKEELCAWLEAHPEAIITSRTFVDLARSGSQNADTVLSELTMRMSAWDLRAIRATTFFDELDLESLIEKPTLFIIELRESEIEMLRPMANTIVVEVLRFLTKRAEDCPGQTLPRPVSLVIDEFASALGRLPDIHVKLNTLRSRNVSIVAAIQSIAQVKANYGQDADSVLAGFGTKILMPALDFQDAEWGSKESGTMTVRYKTASQGTNRKIIENFASKNISSQEVVQQRPVLTPDEIGRPANNVSTFFLPNTPVFQGHLIPYYEVPTMRDHFSGTPKLPAARKNAIDYLDELVKPGGQPVQNGTNGANGANGAANTNGVAPMSKELEAQQREKLEQLKWQLGWQGTEGVAKEWWMNFEELNKHQLTLMLDLCDDLIKRQITITEFFYAYVWSEGNSIDESLKYADELKKKNGGKPITNMAAQAPA